jgi:uncharacterized phage protein (TIGR02218 family)
MRSVPVELASRLASGVTNLAHVWKVTRRDGQVFGFTDHDNALDFGGVRCESVTGLTTGVIEKSLGLSVDTASLSGALSSAAITDSDLTRGLWDGARVDLYRVDWTTPTLSVHLFAGRIGEVRRGAHAFEAELRGLQAGLSVPVGRVFSRFCDADLGDQRCGKNLAMSAFRGAGVVNEIISNAAFRTEGLEAYAAGWFARGRLVWAAGGESEVAAHRVEGADAVLELLDAAGAALALGATFTVYAGCDKRFDTCRVKFANTLNFRGFPHMPGNDAVQAGPIAGQIMDGSSRFA